MATPFSRPFVIGGPSGTLNPGLRVCLYRLRSFCWRKPIQALAGLRGFECYKTATKKQPEAAPAIKQVAHGRCLGRRHGRLILPCRFSVFICFCLCFCAFLRNLLSLRYFCSRRHGFQGVGAFMFYVVFVTRLPGCSISGVSRVNSCSVSAGFQVFLKQSFHFLRVRGIDDADTGIVDVDVLMPHAVDLPRFMYHDP